MESQIKIYRIFINILFYIFYVLIVSLVFSFIFPTLLVVLWQEVLSPNNPVFDSIQIIIIFFVLIFSLIFRKFFYLPIRDKYKIKKIDIKKEIKKEKGKLKVENIEKENDSLELDIKIGKEIK